MRSLSFNLLQTKQMFIVVLFGDSQQELFNPNCKNVMLIENIKKRCHCKDKDMIDLADESGVVKNMNEKPTEQFASEYLEYRRTYILVDVKRHLDVTTSHVFKTYTPLLNGLEESNPEFMAKITAQNRVAANRSVRSAKHNAQTRQGKGAMKTSKNLTTSVPSTRSKSIMNKKRP